jgi:hypothetical protein
MDQQIDGAAYTDEPIEITPVDAEQDDKETKESDVALAQKICKLIREDKEHFKDAFKRMRRDMHVAMHGAEDDWVESNYRANIAGRHVRTKTAALYAKNPKATAKRKETLDFQVWDENEQSLMLAMQTIQMASTMAMTAGATVDPATGQSIPGPTSLPPGFEQAQAVVEDFQQGMQRRQLIKKFGRTLEILFSQALEEQKPLDVKTAMKGVVRRACTTGVGYVRLGYQRMTGPRPGTEEKLADYRARLAHLQRLAKEVQEGEIGETDAEMAELERMIAAVQQEPEIVVREGLVFDYPQSTKVIPHKRTTSLVGFVNAEHLALEYSYTKSQIEEIFEVDIGDQFVPYSVDGKRGDGYSSGVDEGDQSDMFSSKGKSGDALACVWEYFDAKSGLVYWVCDGYKGFLREPAAPDVTVNDFWPIYALTFNGVESEEELFPPSDVTLLLDMQKEYNRSRQGKREHRQAARPRWGYSNGALDDEDIASLKAAKPFDAIGLNIDPQTKLADVLQEIPVPGVDPNLYDVNEIWADAQVVAGSSPSAYGGVSKSTATEAAIASNSTTSSDSSNIDDLDSFLKMIAKAASQILMAEMSEETVMKAVGPGAVWPVQTMRDIVEQVYLDVEAGSTGKPNQAVEINNWKQMLPFLLQMGSIPPTWLARETLRRLDDKMDLTEAVVDGIPAIVAQNRGAQVSTGNPETDPSQQGGKGANNAQKPAEQSPGTGAAFGSNQV